MNPNEMHDFSSGEGCYPSDDFVSKMIPAIMAGIWNALRHGLGVVATKLGIA